MAYIYPLTIDPLGLSRSDSIEDKKAFSKFARISPSNECCLKLTVSQLRLLSFSCSYYIEQVEKALDSISCDSVKNYLVNSVISEFSSIRDILKEILKDVSL